MEGNKGNPTNLSEAEKMVLRDLAAPSIPPRVSSGAPSGSGGHATGNKKWTKKKDNENGVGGGRGGGTWRKSQNKNGGTGAGSSRNFYPNVSDSDWRGKGPKKYNDFSAPAPGKGRQLNASLSASASSLSASSSNLVGESKSDIKKIPTLQSKEEKIESMKKLFCTTAFPPPKTAPSLNDSLPSTAAPAVELVTHSGKATETTNLKTNGNTIEAPTPTFSPSPKWIDDLSNSIRSKLKFGKVEQTPSPVLTVTQTKEHQSASADNTASKLISSLKVVEMTPKALVEVTPPIPGIVTALMVKSTTTGSVPQRKEGSIVANVNPTRPLLAASPPRPDIVTTQAGLITNSPSASQSQSSAIPSSIQDSKGLTMKDLLAAYKQKREDTYLQEMAEKEKQKAKINAPHRVFNRNKVPRSVLEQTKSLPIYSRKDELIELVKRNQFIIVIGETGSGKSTQIPQYLVDAGLHGDGKIGVTQPRRVAARSLAERVSEECGVKTGTSVGYAVRFEKKVSTGTVIKYMTDGLLVKECSSESKLDSYSIIIIDEAHERSIHTDVCFGLLKRAARLRKDLKVIISSATLEEKKFSEYFNGAPILTVPGKGHEVQIIYEPKTEETYMQGAVDIIMRTNRSMPRGKGKGDILVFLPGQDEIEKLWEMLEIKLAEMPGSLFNDLMILPCYGGLPFEEQQKIFDETPENTCKVVLATNIAETSLTIDGIVYVIDCGYFKQNEYNPRSGIYSLVKKRVTKFQAIQRAGRAGRTRPGQCYRLYSEHEFNRTMIEATSPDITRCNVESVILDIISMGIPNPLKFEFMDPPPTEAMMEGMIHLQELGALDQETKLTALGRRMAEFPLDPPLAKVVLESERLNCASEVLKIVALLSTQCQNLFYRGKGVRSIADRHKAKYSHPDGDLLTLLQVYNAWIYNDYIEQWCRSEYIQYRLLVEAEEIRIQLGDILKSRGVSQGQGGYHGRACPTPTLHENIRRAFTAGYFKQVAKKAIRGHGYQVPGSQSWNADSVYMHPSSGLFHIKHAWVIYHEIMATKKPFMREVISIEPAWIKQYAPEYVKKMARFGVHFE